MTKRHNYYFYDMDLDQLLEHGDEFYLPNISIDLVIIGYKDDELKCLLLKIGEKWILPGGHIGRDESVNEAEARILHERAGLVNPHLKFLAVFGRKDRKFDQEFRRFLEKNGIPWKEDYWINDRFLTLSYYSLVDIDNTHPRPGEFDEAVSWFSFDDLPPMWLDHEEIVMTARKRLKEDAQQELITYNLLPDRFTMPQLHQLHQTILGEKLDRSRFQKKMLGSGLFERLPQLHKERPGRNPYQYKLKSEA